MINVLTGLTALATANSLIFCFVALTSGHGEFDWIDWIGLLWPWAIVAIAIAINVRAKSA